MFVWILSNTFSITFLIVSFTGVCSKGWSLWNSSASVLTGMLIGFIWKILVSRGNMDFKNESRSSYLTTCPNCYPHNLYVALLLGIETVDFEKFINLFLDGLAAALHCILLIIQFFVRLWVGIVIVVFVLAIISEAFIIILVVRIDFVNLVGF